MKLLHNRTLILSLCSLSLFGCQTIQPDQSNAAAQQHAEYQQANTALDSPEKIAEKNTHYAMVKSLVDQANRIWDKRNHAALNAQDYTDLTNIYHMLSKFDPNNERASHGLKAVEQAKRHQSILSEAAALLQQDKMDVQAMSKVRQVLLENPDHQQALLLFHQLSQQQEKAVKTKAKLTLKYNEPITMEFREVEIKKLFEALAKITHVNFILDKDVESRDKASIFINSMPFNDALDLILHSNDLYQKVVSDNAVIIYGKYSDRAYTELSVRTYNLDYADAKVMQGILKGMLNLKNIQVDPRLNTLLIKDTPEKLALAEKLIIAQDKPDAEVMLEMQVLEVSRTFSQNLGVDTPTGLTVPVPASGSLTASDVGDVTSGSLIVNGVPSFQFDTSNGDVNILANPRIRVRNKHLAKIHIGEKVPVFTSNVASTGVSTQTIQYIDAGLKMEVEPNISASNDVNIKLSFNVGSIGAPVTAGDSTAFRVGTRYTTTELRLHDGETQILAGLINDQDTKNVSGIPGLKDMPLLGRLFSLNSDSKTKTEIILSVTPHIIRPKTPYSSNEAEIWIGSDSRKGVASPSPKFKEGVTPFFIPKPPPSANRPSPETQQQLPPGLSLPLPPGFSLGNGLNNQGIPPSQAPAPQ